MAIQEKWINAEAFRALANLPENADKHMELIEGVVYEMPPAGMEHGRNGANFLSLIWIYVRQNDLGIVTTAETGYIVYTDPNGKDSILAPDVGFIAKARVPAEPIRQYVPFAPDLAVEVVSPNNSAAQVHTKVNKYLQYGTRMVIVVYSETRTVVVHTPSGAQTLGENDRFDGGEVLPGFKLPVRDIFSS